MIRDPWPVTRDPWKKVDSPHACSGRIGTDAGHQSSGTAHVISWLLRHGSSRALTQMRVATQTLKPRPPKESEFPNGLKNRSAQIIWGARCGSKGSRAFLRLKSRALTGSGRPPFAVQGKREAAPTQERAGWKPALRSQGRERADLKVGHYKSAYVRRQDGGATKWTESAKPAPERKRYG